MRQREIIENLRQLTEYVNDLEAKLRHARHNRKELTAALLGLAKKEGKK
jgi:hypothetical protein